MSWRLQAGLKEKLANERAWGPLSRGGGLRVVLAFANTYRLAMANLGFQTVYGLLARRPDVEVRRACLPDPADLAEHQRHATPWLALEDQRPAAEAEVIAFSLPFEADYLNVLTLLGLAGLPLRAGPRRAGQPLLVAGGLGPTLNPEPLAPYFDLLLLGEAEVLVDDFLDVYQEVRDLEREEQLAALAQRVEGAYAPRFYRPAYDPAGRFQGFDLTRPDLPQRVKRRYALSLERPAASVILSPETEFPNRPLIEISRGCPRGCRFCAAGHILRPPRRPPAEEVLEKITAAAESFGQVGLVSAAVSDHPRVEEFCLAAVRSGAQVSVSSVRADTLSPQLARCLAEGGLKTLTLAPEAGSQRLRDAVNKGLTEAEILEAGLIAAEAGIKNLRLYFMLGLPGETEADVLAIAELTLRLQAHVRLAGEGLAFKLLTLSVSSFVPKPHTPFQWAAMADQASLKRRAKLLRDRLKGEARIKVHFDRPKYAALEALLARGDRRVGEALEAVHRDEGEWARGLAQAGVDLDREATRQRDKDEPFPWEIVDSGISREYLWAEHKKGRLAKTSPGCGEGCARCGVCHGGGGTD